VVQNKTCCRNVAQAALVTTRLSHWDITGSCLTERVLTFKFGWHDLYNSFKSSLAHTRATSIESTTEALTLLATRQGQYTGSCLTLLQPPARAAKVASLLHCLQPPFHHHLLFFLLLLTLKQLSLCSSSSSSRERARCSMCCTCCTLPRAQATAYCIRLFNCCRLLARLCPSNCAELCAWKKLLQLPLGVVAG
jgi:hypothetical protein